MSRGAPSAAAWLGAVALLGAGALHAHDFWIEPSTFRPEPGSTVKVGLRVGENFRGDPVPRMPSLIDRFVAREGGREREVDGVDGADPAGWLVADGRSSVAIAYVSRRSPVELPPAKFETYLRLHGLEWVIAERARRGERSKPGRELFSRCAKAILAGKRPSADVAQPFGMPYEIVPASDPSASAGPFSGRVLYDGKPRSGALVVALLRGDPSVRLTTRSGPAGGFSLRLPRPGVWLIESVTMVEAGWFAKADWESFWASLTFEVPVKGTARSSRPAAENTVTR